MTSKSNRPSAKSLLLEARGEDERFAPLQLQEYADVIIELRRKNYSFAKIAEWLSERLGRPVNKGGVYRAYEDQIEILQHAEAYEDPGKRNYEQTLEEFVDSICTYAADYEAEKGCAGFIEDALEGALDRIRREKEDETAADSVDSSAGSAGDSAEGGDK